MDATRDRIVATTTELFRRYGYRGTSMKQITDASGATTGSVYHFFPRGKQELAAAVVEISGAAHRELFELIADGAIDPADAIGEFFEGAALVLEQTDFIDACPIGTVAREVASTDDELRRATHLVFRSWIAAAADRFGAAGLDRTAAEALATTVVAGIEGGFMLARAARDASPLRTIGGQMRELVRSMTTEAAPSELCSALDRPVTRSGRSSGSIRR